MIELKELYHSPTRQPQASTSTTLKNTSFFSDIYLTEYLFFTVEKIY